MNFIKIVKLKFHCYKPSKHFMEGSMLKKITLPILALSLMTVGCSDSSSKKNKPQPAVPETLEFSKPKPGKQLSEVELREVETIFADKPMMVLPPGELIFPDDKLTQEERANWENNLKVTEPNTYLMLKEIQNNCQISNTGTQNHVNFPIGSDGQVNPEMLKAGDSMSISLARAITGSLPCPGNHDLNLSFDLKLDQINYVKNDLKKSSAQLSTNLNLKNSIKLLKPEYAQLLKANGLIVDGNLSSTAVVLNEKLDFIFRTNISGQYSSIKTTIPYSTSLQLLLKGVKTASEEETTGNVEVVMNTSLKLPNFDVIIDVHMASKNGSEKPTILEVYLNGHKMETDKAQNLFGADSPALTLNPKILKNFKLE